MTLRAFAFAACLAFLAIPAAAENVQIDPAHNTVSCSNCGGSTSTSTGNGATDATTTRVTLSNDSTGQVKATNLPATVATGAGASSASTIRTEPSSSAAVDGGFAQEAGGNLALVAAGMVAQGSTTAGQTGPLVQCATTTAAPTNTTAKTNPLSCDTAGALRISAPAASPVNVTVNTPPNDVLTGPTSLTGAGDVIVNSQGAGSVGLQITGTFTGLSGLVRATVDGTNYFNVPAFNTTTGAAVTPGTAVAAPGSWFVPAAGWRDVEFHVTAVSTGTAVISANASAGSIQPLITPSGASAVDLLGVNGTSIATGNGAAGASVLRVAIASNNTAFSVNSTAQTQTDTVMTGGVNVKEINAVAPLMGNGTTGTGSQRVTIASDNTAFAVNAQPTPVTSGGLSWYFVQPTASDNHVNIKNGAGQVYHIAVTNNSATINYLRLYNAATGFNGCNSATNLVGQWAIPANTSGAGLVADIDSGIAFSTGISICVTSAYATTDTTNATASAMSVNIGYK